MTRLTYEEACEAFTYEADTGVLRWKIDILSGLGTIHYAAGTEAGTIHKIQGYRFVTYRYRKSKVSRLVWLLMTGSWPVNQIDHINGVVDDNRWVNLRDVTSRQNNQNRSGHRRGRLVGSYFSKQAGKWQGRIRLNGVNLYLGYFNTEKLAHEAYMSKLSGVM